MLLAPGEENRLVSALKGFVEEYGSNNVTVHVPPDWKQWSSQDSLGTVRLFFDTKDTVEIVVEWNTPPHPVFIKTTAQVMKQPVV